MQCIGRHRDKTVTVIPPRDSINENGQSYWTAGNLKNKNPFILMVKKLKINPDTQLLPKTVSHTFRLVKGITPNHSARTAVRHTKDKLPAATVG